MKKIFTIYTAIIAVLFTACSCNHEIESADMGGRDFCVSAFASESKTVADGFSVSWLSGDSFNLFHAEAGESSYVSDGKFTIAAADLAAGLFRGTVSSPFESGSSYDWYAIYPYSSHITTPAAATSGYVYIGDSRGEKQKGNNSTAHLSGTSCPLYAVSRDVQSSGPVSLTMKQLSSVLEFEVSNTSDKPLTVKSISFTSDEDIVGSYFIDFTGTSPQYTPKDGYAYDTADLEVENATAIAKGESAKFYLAIKPHTVEAGGEIEMVVNNCRKTKTITSDLVFHPGKVKKVNFAYEAPAAGEATEDVIVADDLVATSTTYKDFSGVTKPSGAVYAGNNAMTTSGAIQLRSSNSNSGIVSTGSAGYARKVSVVWESSTTSGRTIDVYGKSTAYTSASELYVSNTKGTKIGSIVCGTSTELVITSDYEYIGLRSNSGALYLDSVTISWNGDAGTGGEGGGTGGDVPGTEDPTTYSKTYSYGNLEGWSITYYNDNDTYYLVPDESNTESIITLIDLFKDKTVTSDVVVTMNVATYGNGSNPTAETFKFYTTSDCSQQLSADQSGTLPNSKTYTDVVYTISKSQASNLSKDLVIKITKPGRQIRVKSISVKFTYTTQSGGNTGGETGGTESGTGGGETPMVDKQPAISLSNLSASVTSATSITIKGSFSGASSVPTVLGFYWGTSSNNLPNYVSATSIPNSTNGTFTATINGLTEGETYVYCAYAEVKGTGSYASQIGQYSASDTQWITLTSGSTPAVDETWLELASIIEGDARYVVNTTKSGTERNYTVYYDTQMYTPLWTAYPLNSTHMGNLKRPGSWTYNPSISYDYQVNVTGNSYSNGYSRGHMCPNGSRNGISGMQKQTFYVTNQVPQIQNQFNEGIWGSLENAIQGVARKEEIYVVTGVCFEKVGETKTLNYATPSSGTPSKVPVPNYFYKAVLRVKKSGSNITSACTVAFWFEHKTYSDSSSYPNYTISVDQLEQWTGFDFFVNLPDSIEAAAESQNTTWSQFQSF